MRSKRIAALLMALAMAATLFSCGNGANDPSTEASEIDLSAVQTQQNQYGTEKTAATNATVKDETNRDGSQASATTTKPEKEGASMTYPNGTKYPVVTIELEDGGKIYAELYPDKAPNTVNNFISLIKSGYYDGKVFHRAGVGFMVQGGSADGTGNSGGFPYCIPGEFANNGFTGNKDLKHTPGVLSMARVGGMNDSASCQFFIMHADYPSLDGDYATFGKVFGGMDVVDQIAQGQSYGMNYMLVTPVPMKKVTVETFGKAYAEPVTVASPF